MNIVSVVIRRVLIKSILISIFILISVVVNAQVDSYADRMSLKLNFDVRNWIVDTSEEWTMEQRESYLAGVQDAAEAIAFQMSRGVGPKELLHSLVKLFTETKKDLYVYMYNRLEPTGSGRIARWISREVVGVLRRKDYLYAPLYLLNDIGRDD